MAAYNAMLLLTQIEIVLSLIKAIIQRVAALCVFPVAVTWRFNYYNRCVVHAAQSNVHEYAPFVDDSELMTKFNKWRSNHNIKVQVTWASQPIDFFFCGVHWFGVECHYFDDA